ncbi:MAG: ABC transporter permease [Caldilineaceae bacterium]|nr:ABC transporter permease [Caldilineaceae bacterium]MCB0094517.1 ABC transporter permease [Caldilineaceae bacterium]MCB9149364.1 ABC transporter permease [Caldilineaceae bacterium]
MNEVASKSTAAARSSAQIRMDSLRNLLKVSEFVIFIVVIVLLIGGALINPRIMGVENLKIITRDTAILAIAAIGVAFPIITAGIDLSIGSIVGLGGVLSAFFIMNWGMPIFPSILLALLVGVVIGWIHGLFVTRLNMHGFLITLVTLGVARGGILVITNGIPITGLPDEYTYLGQGYLFGLIPIPVILCVVVAIFAHYLLRYTYIGRQIYAVGGNIEATRLSGVNINARVVLCYVISVVCASLVGVIQAGRLSLGHPATGEGFELLAITACILGGLSLMGGQGTVPGILVGSALIGVLQNLMVMLNINPYWHKIVIGLVLLAAITFDYSRRKQN